MPEPGRGRPIRAPAGLFKGRTFATDGTDDGRALAHPKLRWLCGHIAAPDPVAALGG